MNYNNKQLFSGALAGLFAPGFIISIIYAVRFASFSFPDFVSHAIKEHVAAPIIALSLIINLGLFFLFLKYDKLYASRGILLSTLLYGALMLYIRFQ